MSDTPYMPFWIGDFVAKTMDLDAKEVGAYMLILMALWGNKGSIPADPKKVQRVARVGRDWPKVWDSLKDFFVIENGRLSNRRLSAELLKVDTKRAVNAHAGARGGRAKALKEKKARLANATNSLYQPEPEPELEGKPSNIQGEFEAVWEAYPRKVGKGAAAKAWTKARKSTPFIAIAEPLARFATVVRGTDPQFIPHLSTWLNGRRWEDEPDHASNRPRTSTDDLEALSRIPGDSTADLENLFTPQLRIVKQ